MARYCIKYHSTTFAALARRAEQQKLPLPAWRFNFPKLDLKMEIYDSVKKTTGINLHTGLNVVVDLEADGVEKAIEISTTFAETVLNLVSFSVSAYCTPAKLVEVHSKGVEIVSGSEYPFC